MNALKTASKSLFSRLPPRVEWAGVREISETTINRQARDGHPERNHRAAEEGVFVEVLVDGQFGYAAHPDRSQGGIDEAFERAVAQAEQGAKNKVFAFDSSVRPNSVGHYRSPGFPGKLPVKIADLFDLLVRCSVELKVSPRILTATSLLRTVETIVRSYTSSGGEIEQEFSYCTVDLSASAAAPGRFQRRSEVGLLGRSFQGGLHFLLEEEALLARARKVGLEAEELLLAEECPDGTMDLILGPAQMMLQIHESIGHPLEIDRILGDERNFAGWSFVQPGDFGSLKYGTDLLNVTFDPTVPEEFASYGFDDAGEPAKKEFLIRHGVLERGLGGAESRARSGLPGVACHRTSAWNRPAIDRMANINLEPGASGFDEMIAAVERGVYMDSNLSWSIDDFREKFQFGCEYGRLIEGGKLTRTVRNPNYRGVTLPFWNSLEMVGNRVHFEVYGLPNCGKGEPHQLIRVGHASPPCLFRGVEVFGGAK